MPIAARGEVNHQSVSAAQIVVGDSADARAKLFWNREAVAKFQIRAPAFDCLFAAAFADPSSLVWSSCSQRRSDALGAAGVPAPTAIGPSHRLLERL